MKILASVEITKGFDRWIEVNQKLSTKIEEHGLKFHEAISNFEETKVYMHIENIDPEKSMAFLNEIGVISVIKDYFSTKIYSYDNSVLTLGNQKCYTDSMQPHHDSKGRRIKIYIWLDDKNLKTHPLYYLKGTHKQVLNWERYDQTRFSNIDKKEFIEIYGDKGNIIFFDTHGIHSHFKETDVSRSVIELTFEPFGFFNRLNNRNIKSETERLSLIDLDELIN